MLYDNHMKFFLIFLLSSHLKSNIEIELQSLSGQADKHIDNTNEQREERNAINLKEIPKTHLGNNSTRKQIHIRKNDLLKADLVRLLSKNSLLTSSQMLAQLKAENLERFNSE